MTTKPTCIHHSPARKMALRQELYDIIYERTLKHFEEALTEIRTKNMALTGYSWDGFMHAGVYYGQPFPKIQTPTFIRNSDGKEVLMSGVQRAQYKARQHQLQSNQRNQKLDATLAPAMDQLVASREKVERVEGVMVMSTLGSVLNLAQHVEDQKLLLPALLHTHLDEVATECACQPPRLSAAELEVAKGKYGHYINKIRQRQLIYLIKPTP